MKKNIVYILMIILIMSVYTGCTNKQNETNGKDNVGTSDNISTGNDTEDPNDVMQDNNSTSEDNTEIGNTGNKDEIDNGDDGNVQDTTDSELLDIIKKIYEIKDPGLKLADTPVDLSNSDSVKYYTGLSDISKVKEAVVSEAMIGSQAYSLVLVKLNDTKDAESVANEMLKGIDPRKWICVEADDLQIVSHDDVIMLIMVSTALEESVTSQQIVDAFKEVCDNELDMELKK